MVAGIKCYRIPSLNLTGWVSGHFYTSATDKEKILGINIFIDKVKVQLEFGVDGTFK